MKPISVVYTDNRTEDLYQKCVNKIIWGGEDSVSENLKGLTNISGNYSSFEVELNSQEYFEYSLATIRPNRIYPIKIDITKFP